MKLRIKVNNMENYKDKVKPEYRQKLEELGAWEKWCVNYENETDREVFGLKNDNFDNFIVTSFQWDLTPEGTKYWDRIADGKVQKPKDKTDKLRKQLIKVGKYLDKQGYSVTIIIQPKREENKLLKKIKSSLKRLLYFCLPERLKLK
jgi:hypothetical protein